MGDVATQNLFALLGDEGEDPLANLSEAKPDKQEKKKPAAAPTEGRPGQRLLSSPSGTAKSQPGLSVVLTRCWSGGEIGR